VARGSRLRACRRTRPHATIPKIPPPPVLKRGCRRRAPGERRAAFAERLPRRPMMKLAQHAKLSLAAAVWLSALPAGAQTQRRRAPATAARAQDDVERKVNALLARMTLEEKLGQLQQLGGDVGGHANPDLYDIARRGLLGSTLGVRGARNTNDLQRAAVEGSRLKIPLIFGFDVIHGYRTIFPIPLGEAASFDPSAAERSAYVAATEARAAGVHWTFAPMVDIARDARWGRIAEGAGEDTYLGV